MAEIDYVSSFHRILSFLMFVLMAIIGGVMVTEVQVIDGILQQTGCNSGIDMDSFNQIKKWSNATFAVAFVGLLIESLVFYNVGIGKGSILNKTSVFFTLIVAIGLLVMAAFIKSRVVKFNNSITSANKCTFVGLGKADMFLNVTLGISGLFILTSIGFMVMLFKKQTANPSVSVAIPPGVQQTVANVQQALKFRYF